MKPMAGLPEETGTCGEKRPAFCALQQPGVPDPPGNPPSTPNPDPGVPPPIEEPPQPLPTPPYDVPPPPQKAG
jgi:hypothetical protein